METDGYGRLADARAELARHWRGLVAAMRGTRTNLKPSARRMLETYGNLPIQKLQVMRRPLSQKVSVLMNLIGIDKYHKPTSSEASAAVATTGSGYRTRVGGDAGTRLHRVIAQPRLRIAGAGSVAQPRLRGAGGVAHDQLFHLFFVANLGSANIVLEKNEDINLGQYTPSQLDEAVTIPTPSGYTLMKLIGTAIERVPTARLFHYDAFSTNCQRFVIDVIDANRLPISTAARSFILQDVGQLARPWQKKLTSFFTSLANRGKMAIQGEGFDDD